jgi:hypothetical protein
MVEFRQEQRMKKTFFLAVLTLLAVSSFAQEIPNRYISIEGTSDDEEQLEFFLTNFALEAASAGYIVKESRSEAAYTISFIIVPNLPPDTAVENEQAEDGEEGEAPPVNQYPDYQYLDDNKYLMKISLIRNKDDLEVVSFDFFFTELTEVYTYNRELFQNATFYIPPITDEDLILAGEPDDRWKNKWLYLRASFDYPIIFYGLQKEGFKFGYALFNETAKDNPDGGEGLVNPIGNEVMPFPGATIGVEFQFLNFMSFEINFQASMGEVATLYHNPYFINMAAGAELKFPFDLFPNKFPNIIMSPYAAASYSLNPFLYPSSRFTKEGFPALAVGAGIQVSAKWGSRGAFFIDIKYMFCFTDAVMYNPYLFFPEDKQLTPLPGVIHYKRSFIGIGIGYRIGFFDRGRK